MPWHCEGAAEHEHGRVKAQLWAEKLRQLLFRPEPVLVRSWLRLFRLTLIYPWICFVLIVSRLFDYTLQKRQPSQLLDSSTTTVSPAFVCIALLVCRRDRSHVEL